MYESILDRAKYYSQETGLVYINVRTKEMIKKTKERKITFSEIKIKIS